MAAAQAASAASRGQREQALAELTALDVGPRREFRKQLKKTKFCQYHLAGTCKYKAKCTFAHSEAEMRELPDLQKTRLCKAFLQGECNDAGCRFAHGRDDLRREDKLTNSESFFKTAICMYFTSGVCKCGNKCSFAHGSEELRSPDVAASASSDDKQAARGPAAEEVVQISREAPQMALDASHTTADAAPQEAAFPSSAASAARTLPEASRGAAESTRSQEAVGRPADSASLRQESGSTRAAASRPARREDRKQGGWLGAAPVEPWAQRGAWPPSQVGLAEQEPLPAAVGVGLAEEMARLQGLLASVSSQVTCQQPWPQAESGCNAPGLQELSALSHPARANGDCKLSLPSVLAPWGADDPTESTMEGDSNGSSDQGSEAGGTFRGSSGAAWLKAGSAAKVAAQAEARDLPDAALVQAILEGRAAGGQLLAARSQELLPAFAGDFGMHQRASPSGGRRHAGAAALMRHSAPGSRWELAAAAQAAQDAACHQQAEMAAALSRSVEELLARMRSIESKLAGQGGVASRSADSGDVFSEQRDRYRSCTHCAEEV